MGHNFKKKFGQNFLRSSKYARKIAEELNISDNDIVIEIGPGDGKLTQELLKAAPKLLICVEVDYQLVPKLVRRFNNHRNWELVNTDILQFGLLTATTDFSYEYNKQTVAAAAGDGDELSIKVTGSLPYNISKQIISDILRQWPPIAQLTFLVQKEVAQNYCATAPKGSYLGNWLSIYGEPKYLATVPKHEFYPQPQVDGGIFSLHLHQPHDDGYINPTEREKLNKLLRVGFAHPRKTLRNNFKPVANRWHLPLGYHSKRPSEVDMLKVAKQLLREKKQGN